MDINFTAPFCSTSYGMVALNVTKELLKLGHKVSIFPIGVIDGREIPPDFHTYIHQGLENAKFFNPNAPSVRLFHQFDLAQHVGRGKRIGWPIFELNKFNPIELHHLSSQDELIVCSKWAKDVCEKAVNNKGPWMPIHVVPLGVDSTIFSPAQFKDPQKPTTFIHIGKKELRKGHDFILECFEKSFSDSDNVLLIMIWGNNILDFRIPKESKSWVRMYESSRLYKAGKIKLYEWLPSQHHVAQLLQQSDCGLFPSRAEGWNLDLIEAMACGLQVITTYYSAHTEFANEENAHLVIPNDLEDAYEGIWFHGQYESGSFQAQGEWMKIDDNHIDQISRYMLNIHLAKQRGDNIFNEAGVETAKKFSWENTARKLVECLQLKGE